MTIRRFFAALFVSGALIGLSSSARAQAPPPPGAAPAGEAPAGGGEGKDATPGYFAAGFLCVGVIFVVCKSARR